MVRQALPGRSQSCQHTTAAPQYTGSVTSEIHAPTPQPEPHRPDLTQAFRKLSWWHPQAVPECNTLIYRVVDPPLWNNEWLVTYQDLPARLGEEGKDGVEDALLVLRDGARRGVPVPCTVPSTFCHLQGKHRSAV